jgi:hypothetical protein
VWNSQADNLAIFKDALLNNLDPFLMAGWSTVSTETNIQKRGKREFSYRAF